jgi:LPXTG-motif cell wall-anchored protein
MEGEPMQGKHHPIRRVIGASIFTLALVMLSPSMSPAKQGDHNQQGNHNQQGQQGRVHVPEPDTNVLLLMGIGVTGLVGYGLYRRKRKAEKSMP